VLATLGRLTAPELESSCLIYGMPKAAKHLGAVEQEFPLPRIAEEILA